MKKALDNIYNKCKEYTCNEHGSYGKIKTAVFIFYTYVSGQSPQPVQFIVKEIDEQAGYYNNDPGNDKPFARCCIHATKIKFGNLIRVGVFSGLAAVNYRFNYSILHRKQGHCLRVFLNAVVLLATCLWR